MTIPLEVNVRMLFNEDFRNSYDALSLKSDLLYLGVSAPQNAAASD